MDVLGGSKVSGKGRHEQEVLLIESVPGLDGQVLLAGTLKCWKFDLSCWATDFMKT